MFNENLFAKKLKGLEPYIVDTGAYKARLDANESYISLPEYIREKMKNELDAFGFNRYPDPDAALVKRAFCNYYGVKEKCVGVGNGSDEIISLLMNCFLDSGSVVMTFSPDFSMYAFYATLAGMKSVACPKREDFSVDFDLAQRTIKENDVKLVIFSNPCNPTGKIETKRDIEALANACPETIFVVDEAYMDFAEIKETESFLGDTEKYENIVVLKTLSKALGSASLRLGFIVGDEKFAKMFAAVKSPYNVNGVSQRLGEIILSEKNYLDYCTRELHKSTKALYDGIINNGIANPHRTYTNFVFFADDRAQEKWQYLKDNGVLVRKFGIAGGSLRITSGSADENNMVIDLLSKF